MDSLHPAQGARSNLMLMPLKDLWHAAYEILRQSPKRHDIVRRFALQHDNIDRFDRRQDYVDRALVVFIERALKSCRATLYAGYGDDPPSVPAGIIGGKYSREATEPYDGFAAREMFHAPITSYRSGFASPDDVHKEHTAVTDAPLWVPGAVYEQIIANLLYEHGILYGNIVADDGEVRRVAHDIQTADSWSLETALLWTMFGNADDAARLKRQWEISDVGIALKGNLWPWLWIGAYPVSTTRRDQKFGVNGVKIVEVSPASALLQRLKSGDLPAYWRQGGEQIEAAAFQRGRLTAAVESSDLRHADALLCGVAGFDLSGALRFRAVDFGISPQPPKAHSMTSTPTSTIEVRVVNALRDQCYSPTVFSSYQTSFAAVHADHLREWSEWDLISAIMFVGYGDIDLVAQAISLWPHDDLQSLPQLYPAEWCDTFFNHFQRARIESLRPFRVRPAGILLDALRKGEIEAYGIYEGEISPKAIGRLDWLSLGFTGGQRGRFMGGAGATTHPGHHPTSVQISGLMFNAARLIELYGKQDTGRQADGGVQISEVASGVVAVAEGAPAALATFDINPDWHRKHYEGKSEWLLRAVVQAEAFRRSKKTDMRKSYAALAEMAQEGGFNGWTREQIGALWRDLKPTS